MTTKKQRIGDCVLVFTLQKQDDILLDNGQEKISYQ